MFLRLKEAVEELVVPVDGRAIAAAIVLRDRVEAKIAEAVGHFDAESLWDLDAAVSMTAWLRNAADMSPRGNAGRLAMAAKRVRSLPATAEAWRSGELSSGQVHTILGVVGERHLDRFAEHEAALVPTLAPLPVKSVARVMQVWKNGGATCLASIVLLCSRHHHRLHKRGWEAKLLPDATFEVTAPDGRHWVTYPPGAAARLC